MNYRRLISKNLSLFLLDEEVCRASPVFIGGIVWALLIPAKKAPQAQLALWHPTLPVPPVTSSFSGLRLESHLRKRRLHNGHWHYAAVPTEESRSVFKAGAQGWDLSLAASVQTSVHCYSTAYDKSHCSGNNAKMFDFYFPSSVSLQAKWKPCGLLNKINLTGS